MKHMTLKHIAEACHGIYIGDERKLETEISGAVTDSRQVKEGYLFLPIKGARVDGHDFIPAVAEPPFFLSGNWQTVRCLISVWNLPNRR